MIEKDLRKGDREKDLLDKLNSFTKNFRQSYDDGGPVKPVVPINLDEYLELGVKIANVRIPFDRRKNAISSGVGKTKQKGKTASDTC